MPRTGLTKDQLIEKIIELAETRIRDAGFNRLKLTQLASDLGVSHAALYKHVASKDALLDLISEKWLLEIDARLKRVCQASKKPAALLLKWFTTYHELKRDKIRKDPEIYKTFNMAAERKNVFVLTHLTELENQLGAIIEKGKQAGMFQRFSTIETVNHLMNSTIAFHHPALVVEYQEEDRIEELKRLIETLITGLNIEQCPKGDSHE
jgi:AcrR family transcriptional regulator